MGVFINESVSYGASLVWINDVRKTRLNSNGEHTGEKSVDRV